MWELFFLTENSELQNTFALDVKWKKKQWKLFIQTAWQLSIYFSLSCLLIPCTKEQLDCPQMTNHLNNLPAHSLTTSFHSLFFFWIHASAAVSCLQQGRKKIILLNMLRVELCGNATSIKKKPNVCSFEVIFKFSHMKNFVFKRFHTRI